ncbi:nucleotidyltransferase domain-containing protein [Flavobacterium sp.]|jgi:predicted nucleotidyltransferase|uniref:nucleotidyltransferase domain-containing protein n=1 Tax=Flavobacterium sp. TaxID=239 RepID=UPI0037C13F46
MKFGLTEKTINKINSIFEKIPEIDEVIIYGSRAKGNFREGSDIDITLKGNAISSNYLSKINQEIDELNTPYLFDISIFDKLESQELIEHINRVGQTFYIKNT